MTVAEEVSGSYRWWNDLAKNSVWNVLSKQASALDFLTRPSPLLEALNRPNQLLEALNKPNLLLETFARQTSAVEALRRSATSLDAIRMPRTYAPPLSRWLDDEPASPPEPARRRNPIGFGDTPTTWGAD